MRKIFFVFILLIFSNINKTFAVDNVPSSSQIAKNTNRYTKSVSANVSFKSKF